MHASLLKLKIKSVYPYTLTWHALLHYCKDQQEPLLPLCRNYLRTLTWHNIYFRIIWEQLHASLLQLKIKLVYPYMLTWHALLHYCKDLQEPLLPLCRNYLRTLTWHDIHFGIPLCQGCNKPWGMDYTWNMEDHISKHA